MDEKDELEIKVDRAMANLPEATRSAINAVDWRAAIMEIRNKEGYDFIQLGELETETELVLCGLADPQNYPHELERRMGISRAQADILVNEMNERVFKKIKEELIKETERQKIFAEREKAKNDTAAKTEAEKAKAEAEHSASLEELEKELELPAPHPTIETKLAEPTQTPPVKTEHTLDNLTKQKPSEPPKNYEKGQDPYREIPE